MAAGDGQRGLVGVGRLAADPSTSSSAVTSTAYSYNSPNSPRSSHFHAAETVPLVHSLDLPSSWPLAAGTGAPPPAASDSSHSVIIRSTIVAIDLPQPPNHPARTARGMSLHSRGLPDFKQIPPPLIGSMPQPMSPRYQPRPLFRQSPIQPGSQPRLRAKRSGLIARLHLHIQHRPDGCNTKSGRRATAGRT